MTDFQQFKNLIRFLAEQHPDVQHSDVNVHFACSLDSADNAYAHRMHYPCVALDLGDMRFTDETNVERSIVLMFLDHVKDTGSELQRENAFESTCSIAIDFLAQLAYISDKFPRREFSFLSRIDLAGTEMARVELEEAGLYGWMVALSHTFSLTSILCESNFGSDFDTLLLQEFCLSSSE